jgi:hypothetical protein
LSCFGMFVGVSIGSLVGNSSRNSSTTATGAGHWAGRERLRRDAPRHLRHRGPVASVLGEEYGSLYSEGNPLRKPYSRSSCTAPSASQRTSAGLVSSSTATESSCRSPRCCRPVDQRHTRLSSLHPR